MSFLGPKHKSAFWDRTSPTHTSILVYMCVGGFTGPKSSNRIELYITSADEVINTNGQKR